MKKLLLALSGVLLVSGVCYAASVPERRGLDATWQIQEEDGTPLAKAKILKVTDTSLVDNADGTYSLGTVPATGSTPRWNAIINPDGNQALNMSTHTSTWTSVGDFNLTNFDEVDFKDNVDIVLDGVIDIGTVETFTDSDATPTVTSGSYFKTNTSAVTITTFADGLNGQLIYVISGGAITYDFDADDLKCGTADIVTASGDLTVWLNDGTNWILVSFTDQSDDLS